MQGRRLCAASIIAAFAASGFFGLAALSAYGGVNPHGTAIEVGLGVMAGIIAAMCALTSRRERQDRERAQQDRDKELLIRTLAGVVPARPSVRPLRPTRPYPVPRAL